MKTLKTNYIQLNNQQAGICVSIMGKTLEEIMGQAEVVREMLPDVVEWRADDFLAADKLRDAYVNIRKIFENLRNIFPETSIIFTTRTFDEGGALKISDAEYTDLCIETAKIAKQYQIDFIDVEAYRLENAKELIEEIHRHSVRVIGSNHDFAKTPSREKMIEILKSIEQTGADICKLAVMPKEKEDVTALIEASKNADELIDAPIITMSMSELGAVTRVCTKLTGSVLTFASGKNASAPGQPDIKVVRKLLQFHNGCMLNGNIVLIGFMGTGKTTVSKALSRITGLTEVDVDAYIVEKEKMTISEIFEKKGEEGFRSIETKALREITKNSGQIISCGGGAVLKDENVELLKNSGTIILLTATPETVFERVKDHTHRPILNQDMSLAHVKKLMEVRQSRYSKVKDIEIGVDNNDRVMTCYHILCQLEREEK